MLETGTEERGDGGTTADVVAARAARLDDARPGAVKRQHDQGRWTARERIDALADLGSFVEYGGLLRPATAALDGPADGLVAGHATVDGRPVCLMSYDYTVQGGSQSPRNFEKMDRMLTLAREHRLPVVIWSEGGGVRAQEMDLGGRSGTPTFATLASLSGWVPTVTILPGRAFAGNANLAGIADTIIATRAACIGMAGPLMVRAATGEDLTPEELGSADLHESVGAVDIVVDDEAVAVGTARKYLSYFRGRIAPGQAPDVTALTTIVPESPRRAFDVRSVIEHLADVGTVLELRPAFARNAVTTLARLGGHAVGIVANQSSFSAGSIDAPSSDKMARFIQLCDAYDIPVVFLCDTPGFMVGLRTEQTALVRHSARILVALANATVPILTVVLRKAYGFGLYAMATSRAFSPAVLIAWPSAEYGHMAPVGAAEIVLGDELRAARNEDARLALISAKVEEIRAKGMSLEAGRTFRVDDVVPPADTRGILIRTLDTVPPPPVRSAKKHPVDPW
jgi:acetyl-CoA carboxylase carboxyltransferase component